MLKYFDLSWTFLTYHTTNNVFILLSQKENLTNLTLSTYITLCTYRVIYLHPCSRWGRVTPSENHTSGDSDFGGRTKPHHQFSQCRIFNRVQREVKSVHKTVVESEGLSRGHSTVYWLLPVADSIEARTLGRCQHRKKCLRALNTLLAWPSPPSTDPDNTSISCWMTADAGLEACFYIWGRERKMFNEES